MFQIQSRSVSIDPSTRKRSYVWQQVFGTPTSKRARDLEAQGQRLADRSPHCSFRVAKSGAARAVIVLTPTSRLAGPNSALACNHAFEPGHA